jgi:hypothetical protein
VLGAGSLDLGSGFSVLAEGNRASLQSPIIAIFLVRLRGAGKKGLVDAVASEDCPLLMSVLCFLSTDCSAAIGDSGNVPDFGNAFDSAKRSNLGLGVLGNR